MNVNSITDNYTFDLHFNPVTYLKSKALTEKSGVCQRSYTI